MQDSGRVPNIYWRALTFTELRDQNPFHALPPVESILLNSTASYRYIRQDDPLWSRLHAGILTTGYLPSLLGFYEPECSKRLSLGRDRVSHSHIVHAYHHLCQQRYIPQVNPHITAEAADAHNAQVVAAYNNSSTNNDSSTSNSTLHPTTTRRVQSGVASNVEEGATTTNGATLQNSSNSSTTTSKTAKHNRKRRKNKNATNTQPTATPDQDAIAAFHLKHSRIVAQQGITAVRCAWGSAQEASSLYQLMKVFHDSQLVESGLYYIEPETSELLKGWGFGVGDLPPLGSSPDAIIRHSLLPTTRSTSSNGTPDPLSAQLQSKLNLTTTPPTTSTNTNTPTTSPNYIEEIVEVKNACPFAFNSNHQNNNNRHRHRYILSDRGPRTELSPAWIPQLQLQMLCANTTSGLLVSRSATKGIRIFRVPRDDEYLILLLNVTRRIYKEHVVVGKGIPKDYVWRWKEQGELVGRSRAIARGAEVVVVVDESVDVGGGRFCDPRFFLE